MLPIFCRHCLFELFNWFLANLQNELLAYLLYLFLELLDLEVWCFEAISDTNTKALQLTKFTNISDILACRIVAGFNFRLVVESCFDNAVVKLIRNVFKLKFSFAFCLPLLCINVVIINTCLLHESTYILQSTRLCVAHQDKC